MYGPDKPRMREVTDPNRNLFSCMRGVSPAVEPRGPDRLSADRPFLLRLGGAEQSWVAVASQAVERAAIFVPATQTAEKA